MSDEYFEQENIDDMIAGLNNWHAATARGYLDTIYDLQSRITELEEKLRWRDASEELPTNELEFRHMVVLIDNCYLMCQWVIDSFWTCEEDARNINIDNVDMWFLIPELEEVKDE